MVNQPKIHPNFATGVEKFDLPDGSKIEIETTSCRWGLRISNLPADKFAALILFVNGRKARVQAEGADVITSLVMLSAIHADVVQPGDEHRYAVYVNVRQSRRSLDNKGTASFDDSARIELSLLLGVEIPLPPERD